MPRGPWQPREPVHETRTYLQALLTSKNRDTPVWAAATSMCTTTSAETVSARLAPRTRHLWPEPQPVVGGRAPTCAGGHQLVQPLHRHAARVVEVGHVRACGRVCGVHHEVSYHEEGPHFIQPGLLIIIQPVKEQCTLRKGNGSSRAEPIVGSRNPLPAVAERELSPSRQT